MEITLYELGEILGSMGNYFDFPNIKFKGIKTDSRLVEQGDLFICLIGKNFDAHGFAKDAVAKGATGIVAMRWITELQDQVPIVIVPDTYNALLEIAKYMRDKFGGKVIAITGSCGKTSTKEILYSILAKSHKTEKNYKNWNNLVGVPLSIFSFSGKEDFWILELGISFKNEMEKLGDVVKPDIACITNLGPVHLQGLGSVEGVAHEKSKLISFVKKDGFCVINKDYKELVKETEKYNVNKIYFGDNTKFQIKFLGVDDSLKGLFNLILEDVNLNIKTNLNLSVFSENILAAATTAYLLGVNTHDIVEGIKAVLLPEHRTRWFKAEDILILDDCYNANPMSMRRIFDDLSKINIKRPLIAIIGDMLELGDVAEKEHYKLGKYLGGKDIDIIFYKGKFFEKFSEGIRQQKNNTRLFYIASINDFIDIWNSLKIFEGTVVVKGSRGMKLEKFVDEVLRSRG